MINLKVQNNGGHLIKDRSRFINQLLLNKGLLIFEVTTKEISIILVKKNIMLSVQK